MIQDLFNIYTFMEKRTNCLVLQINRGLKRHSIGGTEPKRFFYIFQPL